MRSRRVRDVILLMLSLPIVAACATAAATDRTGSIAKSKVVFLCPYGGAKSVIAASYFNRLADQRALPYVGIAVAAEDPYDAVPPLVASFLEREGFDVRAFKPRHVQADDVKNAAKLVSIDCNLAGVDVVAGAPIERWNDVPKVSVDLAASAAAIRRHVEALVAALPVPAEAAAEHEAGKGHPLLGEDAPHEVDRPGEPVVGYWLPLLGVLVILALVISGALLRR